MRSGPRKNRIHSLIEKPMETVNECSISAEPANHREQLTKAEYSPISSSRKLNLLLQRSLRYSYRKRCCRCCPTILCELLFPIILIIILALTRYGTNVLLKEINGKPRQGPSGFQRPKCSQDSNISTTLSNDVLGKCLKFPPSYKSADPIRHSEYREWPSEVSNRTNIIFQPMTNDTKQLADRAHKRLTKMGCNQTKVW